jgi:hypothetical protein
MFTFMSMGRDYVSELQPPTGILLITHMICMENHGGMILKGETEELGE